MPFSYNPAELATNELYQVRAEIQDTDPNDQQLQDEEIVWAASQERNFWGAAARCLEMIARNKLRKADVRLGRALMVTYTKMAQNYVDQARRLRMKSMGTIAPFIGGMSVTDKLNYSHNSDLVQPLFTKTLMENPWVGPYSTDSGTPVGGGERAQLENE